MWLCRCGWALVRKVFMAAITAYFDASGDPDDTPVLSLGGIISTADQWISFSEAWNECLRHFEVSALHMKDFAHFKGEFESWKYDEPRRRRFLKWLLEIIEVHALFTVAATVWMSDYQSVDKRYQLNEFMKPYTVAASTCVGAISKWAAARGNDAADIAYIFEKGDTDQDDVNRCWNANFSEYRLSPIFLKKADQLPNRLTVEPIRPFEAADLLSYESLQTNKTIKKHGSVFFEDLRRPMQKLSQLPGADDWKFFEEKDLEIACGIYRVPRRP